MGVLGELSKYRDSNRPKVVEDDVRESVLISVAYKVADVVGEPDEKKITVSLLDFSCVNKKADNGKMRVVARSAKERRIGIEYPRESLVGACPVNS